MTAIRRTLLILLATSLVTAGCSRRSDNGATAPNATGPGTTAPLGTTPGSSPGTTTVGPQRGGLVPYGLPIKAAVPTTAKAVEGSLTAKDGRERTYRVYVPSTLSKRDGKAPLLIAMHGGLGWAEQYENNSGFDGLAEANGFIVVYPDGNKLPVTPNGRVWNGGGCCAVAAQDRENYDDVGFISQLIDKLVAEQPIDATRVYATGHSNGAIMSYRLACELTDKIAAIAVQAGTVFVDDCKPSRPIPVLHIHGTADENLPLAGGKGTNGVSGADFPPPLDGIEKIAASNGCPASPTTSADQTNKDVTFDSWAPCKQDAVIVLVKVAGANHAWMGHEPSTKATEVLVGTPYLAFDSSAAVWSFLSAQ